MSSSQQRAERRAFAKVRARIRRETADSGEAADKELNLVPYLDIVVNTVIFMLATTALTVGFGQIDISAPGYVDDEAIGAGPQVKKVPLTIGVTYAGFTIMGGDQTLRIDCDCPLRKGRCPVRFDQAGDGYNYAALSKQIQRIKSRLGDERRVALTADRAVPYSVLVRTMDILRGTPTPKCAGKGDGCLFDRVTLAGGVR